MTIGTQTRNYQHKRVDLATARSVEAGTELILPIAGTNAFFAGSTALEIDVRLVNTPNIKAVPKDAPQFTMNSNGRIEGVPFEFVVIENTAQAGKYVDVFITQSGASFDFGNVAQLSIDTTNPLPVENAAGERLKVETDAIAPIHTTLEKVRGYDLNLDAAAAGKIPVQISGQDPSVNVETRISSTAFPTSPTPENVSAWWAVNSDGINTRMHIDTSLNGWSYADFTFNSTENTSTQRTTLLVQSTAANFNSDTTLGSYYRINSGQWLILKDVELFVGVMCRANFAGANMSGAFTAQMVNLRAYANDAKNTTTPTRVNEVIRAGEVVSTSAGTAGGDVGSGGSDGGVWVIQHKIHYDFIAIKNPANAVRYVYLEGDIIANGYAVRTSGSGFVTGRIATQNISMACDILATTP